MYRSNCELGRGPRVPRRPGRCWRRQGALARVPVVLIRPRVVVELHKAPVCALRQKIDLTTRAFQIAFYLEPQQERDAQELGAPGLQLCD